MFRFCWLNHVTSLLITLKSHELSFTSIDDFPGYKNLSFSSGISHARYRRNAGDQLLRGAALNAVLIAEAKLLKMPR